MLDLPRSTAIAPCSFGIGFSGGWRLPERKGSRGCAGFVGNLELWRSAPEALQVVITPRLLAEHVHDEAAEINERPIGGAAPLAVFRRAMKMLFELLLDFDADGLHLRRTESGADHEVVREGADAAEVQNDYSRSFFVLRRLDSQTDALWQRIQFHRYRPCLRMYSSTRTETSP